MQPQPEQPKRKNQLPRRAIVNAWGCALSIIMLVAGGVIGVLGGLLIVPEIWQFDVTGAALDEREIALAATAADLEQRAADFDNVATENALALQATGAVLVNEAALLGQTATQSARDIHTTQTAIAVTSAQQRTQVAQDQLETQTAFDQNATAIQLDFQRTQQALGIATGQASSAGLPLTATLPPTQTALPIPTASPTDAPTLVSAPDAFSGMDWLPANNAGALEAQIDGAWLLTGEGTSQVSFTFRPALRDESRYGFLLNVGELSGLMLQIEASGLEANSVALYRFDRRFLEARDLLPARMLQLEREAIDVVLVGESVLELQLDAGRITATLNEEPLLSVNVDRDPLIGQVGVYFPQGAQLIRTTQP